MSSRMTSRRTSRMTRRQFVGRLTAASLLLSAGLPRLASAAGLSLDDIKKAGVLRIRCGATYPPFTFREGGVLTGYDVDLANAFCKTLAVTPQFVDTVWAGVIPALYARKFDLGMSGLSYTAEREKKRA